MDESPQIVTQRADRLKWWPTIAAIVLGVACARKMQLDNSGLFPSPFIFLIVFVLICSVVGLAILFPYWVIRRRPKRVGTVLCAILAFLVSLVIWCRVLDITRLKLAEISILHEVKKNAAAGQPNKQVRRLLHQGWSDFDVLVYDPSDTEANIPSDVATAKANEAGRKTGGLVISTSLGEHFYREWTDYGQ